MTLIKFFNLNRYLGLLLFIWFGVYPILADSIPVNDSIALKTNKQLIVRGFLDREPFEFIDENGQPAGFCVDLLNALIKEMGYQPADYDFKLGDYDVILPKFINGEVDLITGAIYNEDYVSKMCFSLPTLPYEPQFVVKSENAEGIKTINDLKGKRIGVISNTWMERYVREKKITEKIVNVKNTREGMNDVDDGLIDVYMDCNIILSYNIERYGFNDLKIKDLGLAPLRYSIISNSQK
ncbi:MAG: transporter substrate-binding domain-containing protein [Muribaculaceae bacterium]|nr:transporter substrate-binding domain-containing protein [Muribaculaceae bacterium]